jgi:hypothetical protein
VLCKECGQAALVDPHNLIGKLGEVLFDEAGATTLREMRKSLGSLDPERRSVVEYAVAPLGGAHPLWQRSDEQAMGAVQLTKKAPSNGAPSVQNSEPVWLSEFERKNLPKRAHAPMRSFVVGELSESMFSRARPSTFKTRAWVVS